MFRWLDRLTIQGKFLVAPLVGILVLSAVVLVVLAEIDEDRHLLNRLSQSQVPLILEFQDVTRQLIHLHAELHRAYVRRFRERDLDGWRVASEAAVARIDRLAARTEQLGGRVPAIGEQQGELGRGMDEYCAALETVLERDGADWDAVHQSMETVETEFRHMEATLQAIFQALEAEMDATMTRVREGGRQQTRALVMLALVTVALTLALSIGLARHLTKDLRRLIRVTGALARGERDEPIPHFPCNGELEQLADALEYFKHSARELDRQNRELQLAGNVFEHSHQGIMITDADGRIEDVNGAFESITGYGRDEAVGRTPRLLRSERHGAAFYARMWESLRSRGYWEGEIWNRRSDGEVIPVWSSIVAIRDEAGRLRNYVNIFTDITERKLSEERIHHLAYYDVLTDLPNRAHFQERLSRAIQRARRHDQCLALLFVDLDHFKDVNDGIGHPLGDLMLQETGRRLLEAVRAEDTVARLGGDEFVVLVEELESAGAAAAVAEKVLGVFESPFVIDAHELYVSASVGVAVFPGDADDVTALISRADAAMYGAKRAGRNRFAFFSSEFTHFAQERLELESRLRHALANDEFHLVYHPQLRTEDGRCIGAEALIRWEHPELGTVSPARFIPLAEELGLIERIGDWVLDSALAEACRWQERGLDLKVSVNLSGRQIVQDDLVDRVRRCLERYDLSPDHVELEITETSLMENAERAADNLRALKLLGVGLAIDDFGTGYSSMSYLKQFDVDVLKIDRSFVRDIGSDANDEAIAGGVIAMAHSLGLEVIAEGVESRVHVDFLHQAGCDYLQGFLFARPLPASAFVEWARARDL